MRLTGLSNKSEAIQKPDRYRAEWLRAHQAINAQFGGSASLAGGPLDCSLPLDQRVLGLLAMFPASASSTEGDR